MLEEANAYRYGNENNKDGHLIFFPNHTKSEQCISEWNSAGKAYTDRGMCAWREDLLIYEKFFNTSYLNGNHVYMEIGAHE